MTSRASSPLLLVGSLPADSTEGALRAAAGRFGDMVFAFGLPFPSSALNGFKADFAADCPVAERAFEDLVARELCRLTTEIPPEDLAIQWDVCYGVLDIEGVLAWTADGAWEWSTRPVARLTPLVLEHALVGYHFRHGTSPGWPMYEPRDMRLVVRMANHAVAGSGGRVDFVHMAGPRHLCSEDERLYRPLAGLAVGDTRVCLGIVLPIDGTSGLRRRHPTASKFLRGFGVAVCCGFGRQPGADGMETMHEHRRMATSI
jgi:hypothetical protein